MVVERMIAHRALLFATPVYWYAMSGRLKTLFDRFTDLLSDRDPAGRGRRLAGRSVWVLAVGADPALPAGFETPFRSTAAWLGMEWGGSFYVERGGGEQAAKCLSALAARLRAHLDP
jgi:NAD(P)H-dependent FMN reductase